MRLCYAIIIYIINIIIFNYNYNYLINWDQSLQRGISINFIYLFVEKKQKNV